MQPFFHNVANKHSYKAALPHCLSLTRPIYNWILWERTTPFTLDLRCQYMSTAYSIVSTVHMLCINVRVTCRVVIKKAV